MNKSLVFRLAAWFAVSIVLATTALICATQRHLKEELLQKSWEKNYPNHPDWKLHGSYASDEVDDIVGEVVDGALVIGLPLALGAALFGYWIARKSLLPIQALNAQLARIGAKNLGERVTLPEVDREFRDLEAIINGLLARLETSFAEMSEYAAKVAHELRTPLAILRLKVEECGAELPPKLSEDIQSELRHLTHVVDDSLLIAKAEQGRIVTQPTVIDLAAMLSEMVIVFEQLADDAGRKIMFALPSEALVNADVRHVRQIIHNLLTNAYKHGKGTITITLSSTAKEWLLSITNEVAEQRSDMQDTLGLGLRVIDSLVRLQPDLKCTRRHAAREFIAELQFPRATAADAHKDYLI